MKHLYFCTGNAEKFANAQLACMQAGVTIEQYKADIEEIQSATAEPILRDKLQKAYELCKEPVVVSDDTWEIPALNGFPGPYMKQINQWFTVHDYQRLTANLPDRTIYLVQNLGFTDGNQVKLFTVKTKGEILYEPKGNYGAANHKLVSLEGDNGYSIAEIYDQGLNNTDRHAATVWHDFIAWYNASN